MDRPWRTREDPRIRFAGEEIGLIQALPRSALFFWAIISNIYWLGAGRLLR
jgi:hypothetical protein